MAYVAAGRYDGYFQNNLNLWDIAAGIILVKEAGGILMKLIFQLIKISKLLPLVLILIQNYLKN
jgi:fructose-1,6-bisphosphatase/inositol monophosphatase family enzyme